MFPDRTDISIKVNNTNNEVFTRKSCISLRKILYMKKTDNYKEYKQPIQTGLRFSPETVKLEKHT